MSTNEDSINTKTNTDGKNKETVFCTFCPSKILNVGAATFVIMEVNYIKYIVIIE